MKRVTMALLPVLVLAACSSAPKKGDTSGAEQSAPSAAADESTPAQTRALDSAPVAQPKAISETPAAVTKGGDAALPATRVIYFDYDDATIRAEFREVLAAHARYLASHPNVRITVQGHCDERGTREYNMGLGERRANAVKKFLSLQGAGGKQMEAVSFGEERPVDSGHDDAAWAKNRRVEIVYSGR
ncbi:MAG: peptidoglycan-associated lipoprotein Pal [Gammaproteobacteria bacterium]|nr:peptidoglycan-associated lipoprotein Pal [Gammaproteobacteria bacterium]